MFFVVVNFNFECKLCKKTDGGRVVVVVGVVVVVVVVVKVGRMGVAVERGSKGR